MTLNPITTSTQRRWVADLLNAQKALEPWIREHPEGFAYIDETAPRDLVKLSRDLTSLGFARGWFA